MADCISVIVPVYNVAKELPRCLNSVLAQTYPNVEIIAINDGSLDNSGRILDQYASTHPNIRVIHKDNGGVTSARLRGVEEATGEWIGFVDGDDEIESDMYERLLENAKKHSAQISHCGYQMLFSDGRVHCFHNTGCIETHDKITAQKELLSGVRIEPGLGNKLFRRDLFHGWEMDLSIKINEDLLMNYYLFSQASTSVFDDWCPYHYIVRSSSASRAKMNPNKIYDPIQVKEIIRKTAPEELQGDAQRAYVNTCINSYHALLFLGPAYWEDLNRIRDLLRQERTSFSLLGMKRELMARLIIGAPIVYKPIYSIYCRYFQKSVYS